MGVMQPLLLPSEAAGLLQVSEKTLGRLRNAGLKFVLVGRSIRYRADDLESYIESRTCHSAPKVRASGTTTSKSGVVDFMDLAGRKTSNKPRR
ncbi:MAG: helix-turn-helix domain-containing protein [Cypionkella sp.]